MAEDKEETKEPVAAPQKASKVPLIIAGVFGLIILGGVPAGYFLLKKKEAQIEELAANAAQAEEGVQTEGMQDEEEYLPGEEPLGALFPLDTFVVNIQGGGILRVQMQLEFVERDVPKRLYSRLTLVRDAVITLVSNRPKDDLLTVEGKNGLKDAVKVLINELLRQEVVKKVYFTQFTIANG